MAEIELPYTIGKVAKRELIANGYTTLDQLASVTEKEILAIHGVGPKAIRLLKVALKEQGIDAVMLYSSYE